MLETEIVKLREAIEALTAKIGTAPTETTTPEAEKEQPKNQDEGKNTVTLQDVKDVTLAKSRDGFKAEIRGLLSQFGVKKIQELDAADYEKYIEAVGKIR